MHPQYTPEQIEKFWSRVETSDPDSCWNWTGYVTPHGYGTFYVGEKRYIRAHRLSFILAFGWLEDNLVVAHKCDNPSCVNPRHLVACSQRENVEDRNRKGRQDHGPNAPRWTPPPPKGQVRGERAAKAKLTADQVRAIRAEYQQGVRGKGVSSLAKKYGVHDYAIEMIVKRKSWKHI